jgi:hypothetical protein
LFSADIEEDSEDFGIYEDKDHSGISASCGVPPGEGKVNNQKTLSDTHRSGINGVTETEEEAASTQLRVSEQRVRQLEEELGRVLGDFEKMR